MKYEIIGRDVKVTEAMKEHITSKLSVVEKYFLITPETKARIVVKVHKNDQKVEITIPTKTVILRSEVMADNFYTAVDLAIDKLEDQIRRNKTRLAKRKKKDSFTENFIKELEQEQKENEVEIKEKTILISELDFEEAISEMELTGHDFYAFKDKDDSHMCIAYKRDAGYGIIHIQ